MNSEWVNEDGRLIVSLRAHRGREEGANLGIYQAWRHKLPWPTHLKFHTTPRGRVFVVLISDPRNSAEHECEAQQMSEFKH